MGLGIIVGCVLAVMASAVLFRVRSGDGLMRTGVHMMLFTAGAVFIFYLYSIDVFISIDDPCAFGAEKSIAPEVVGLFSCLFAVFLLADLCSSTRVHIQQQAGIAFADTLRATSGWLGYAAIILMMFCIGHFMTRDFSILWQSSTYLLMMSPDAGIPGAFSSLISSGAAPAYMASCIALGIAYSTRRFGAAWLVGICASWLGILHVSAASRVAGIGVLLFSLVRAVIAGPLKPTAIGGTMFGLYLVVSALAGRALGEFGLSNFFNQLLAPIYSGGTLSFLVMNLFQGAISTADGLLVGGGHPWQYQVLSVSPLPSFIDGFNEIRENSEIRLHMYCPMSAIAELTHFGPYFYAPFGIAYIGMVALINSRSVQKRVGPLPVLAANCIFTLFSIVAFTYPLRNVARILIYGTIALAMFAWIGGAKNRDQYGRWRN